MIREAMSAMGRSEAAVAPPVHAPMHALAWPAAIVPVNGLSVREGCTPSMSRGRRARRAVVAS